MNWPGSRADEMVSTETEKRRRRWPFWVAGVVVLVVAGAGLYVWRQFRVLTSSKYNVINYTVPERAAPRRRQRRDRLPHRPDAVVADLRGRGEALRPGRAPRPRARRTASPATSRSTPRTRRRAASARSSSTSSSCTPTTTCATRGCAPANLELARLPARVPHGRRSSRACPRRSTTGQPYHFTMDEPAHRQEDPGAGHLGRRRDASTTASSPRPRPRTVKMSTFGIGPISIAGLVSTSDDVDAHDEAHRARPVEVHGARPRSPRRRTRRAAATARRSRTS